VARHCLIVGEGCKTKKILFGAVGTFGDFGERGSSKSVIAGEFELQRLTGRALGEQKA
jgi:hypothetical protein